MEIQSKDCDNLSKENGIVEMLIVLNEVQLSKELDNTKNNYTLNIQEIDITNYATNETAANDVIIIPNTEEMASTSEEKITYGKVLNL